METKDLNTKISELIKEKEAFKLPASYFDQFYSSLQFKMNLDELISIQPGQGSEVFETPNRYFDTFEDRLMDRLDHDRLMQIGLKTTNPFITPPQYFERLTDRVVFDTKASSTRKISFKISRMVRYAVAACVLIALAITVFKFSDNNVQSNSESWSSLSEEELLVYIQENAYEYDLSSLSGLLNEEELEAIVPDQNPEDLEIDELIEEFL